MTSRNGNTNISRDARTRPEPDADILLLSRSVRRERWRILLPQGMDDLPGGTRRKRKGPRRSNIAPYLEVSLPAETSSSTPASL
jgi:hypothetical protein